MNYDPRIEDRPEHQEIAALLPWYVNGSIGELDRQKVDSHLQTCAVCRDDLLMERRVYQGMAAEVGVEYMPATSLKRLQARLDELDVGSAASSVSLVSQPARRSLPWQGLMAASIAAMALALGLLATDRWMEYRSRASSSDYYTVTAPASRAPDVVIRAVFSPAITLAELQVILDESGLRIVSGPTQAGVYSLAEKSTLRVDSSLALLRRHATVRFAESAQ